MELKFRAWNKEAKRMADDLTIPMLMKELAFVLANPSSEYIFLQYIPLKDKNGNQYCQDDIVCYDGKNYRLIKGSYQFELLGFFRACQDIPSDYFSENCWKHGEIVGNIHETPHLLT